jgi:hypothetical protein
LITPSHWRNLERCAIPVESVSCAPDLRPYRLIANRAVRLFKLMLDACTDLIEVEPEPARRGTLAGPDGTPHRAQASALSLSPADPLLAAGAAL